LPQREIGMTIWERRRINAGLNALLHLSARMPAMKRRTLLQALPAATLFPASLWASEQDANPKPASTVVYELRVYHAAPGKLGELLARFRDHTIKIFDRHGLKS